MYIILLSLPEGIPHSIWKFSSLVSHLLTFWRCAISPPSRIDTSVLPIIEVADPTKNLFPLSLLKSPMQPTVDGPVDISCQEFLDITASIFGSVRGLFARRFNNSFHNIHIVGEIERQIRCRNCPDNYPRKCQTASVFQSACLTEGVLLSTECSPHRCGSVSWEARGLHCLRGRRSWLAQLRLSRFSLTHSP